MRARRDYRDLHAAADAFEPRVTRAFLRAVARVRSRVSINELAMALQARDQKRAMAVIVRGIVKDAMGPVGAIVEDAVAKGGRLGAEAVNKGRA